MRLTAAALVTVALTGCASAQSVMTPEQARWNQQHLQQAYQMQQASAALAMAGYGSRTPPLIVPAAVTVYPAYPVYGPQHHLGIDLQARIRLPGITIGIGTHR